MPKKGTVPRTCEWCGCRFYAKAAEVAAGHARFHSRACYVLWVSVNAPRGAEHPRWKGDEHHKRGGRERARAWYPIAGRVCAECEAAPAMERHHWDGNALNNHPANVVFLCFACHHRMHTNAITHCKRGHPFDAANTGVDAKGHRWCRACMAALRRDRTARTRVVVPLGLQALIRVRYATGRWTVVGLGRVYGLTGATVSHILSPGSAPPTG